MQNKLDKRLYDKISLLRNHGLKTRDEVEIMGYNSRLDTFQAVVGNWLIPKTHSIANQRIKNANYLDTGLSKLDEIRIPPFTNWVQAPLDARRHLTRPLEWYDFI